MIKADFRASSLFFLQFFHVKLQWLCGGLWAKTWTTYTQPAFITPNAQRKQHSCTEGHPLRSCWTCLVLKQQSVAFIWSVWFDYDWFGWIWLDWEAFSSTQCWNIVFVYLCCGGWDVIWAVLVQGCWLSGKVVSQSLSALPCQVKPFETNLRWQTSLWPPTCTAKRASDLTNKQCVECVSSLLFVFLFCYALYCKIKDVYEDHPTVLHMPVRYIMRVNLRIHKDLQSETSTCSISSWSLISKWTVKGNQWIWRKSMNSVVCCWY